MSENYLNPNFEAPKEQQSRDILYTNCDGCIFFEEHEKNYSCKLGRIKKYSELGYKKFEVSEADDKTHLEIDGVLCSAKRTEIWEISKLGEDLEAALYKELNPKVGFFIIVGETLDGIEKTIQSALNQEDFKPKHIMFCSKGLVPITDLIDVASSILGDKDIPFKVKAMTHLVETDFEFIDKFFINSKNGYSTFIESGREFKSDLIKTLTKATQEDMKNVALIEGYDGINGYTYQGMTYKFLFGNRGESCEDKIKFGQEYDNLPKNRKLLWKWEELQ